jgi:Rrf2 family transcriptional regulator, nitric oxide-sensitive transcriptional repressor
MHLTQHTDYALRTLIYLALRDPALATVQEIAEAYGISRTHLMKVAHRLGRCGWIETVRGRGGGLRLARRPEDIVVGDVVRDTEEGFAIVECFSGDRPACRITPDCALKGVLAEARDAFLAVLDGHTLAELTAHEAGLRRALDLEVPPAA